MSAAGSRAGGFGRKAHTLPGTTVAFNQDMWLDAIVTAGDLQQVVNQLTPATVPLGDRGHLYFDAPAEVSLVAERGLRIRCGAKLLWPLLGIDVAITISSMTILVVPSIEARGGERAIVFTPEVEQLDLALLPDIGDAEVRSYINRELQAKRIELPWNYKQTLDHQFVLPEWFRDNATFDIRSNGAAVKVTNDSIGLAIGLTASVGSAPATAEVMGNGERRRQTGHNGVWIEARGPVRSSAALVASRRRSPWLGLAFAIASGFGLGCLVGLRQVSR